MPALGRLAAEPLELQDGPFGRDVEAALYKQLIPSAFTSNISVLRKNLQNWGAATYPVPPARTPMSAGLRRFEGA